MRAVACDQCPWRKVNQSKRHKFGFFTQANLKRLWNGLRKGNPMSCHKTDTGHPDHVACGAKGDKPKECAGSIIVIRQELQMIANWNDNTVTDDGIIEYKKRFKQSRITVVGFMYWVFERIQMAGVPIIGGKKLPEVDHSDEAIGLPESLKAKEE